MDESICLVEMCIDSYTPGAKRNGDAVKQTASRLIKILNGVELESLGKVGNGSRPPNDLL
jgi:hypothetical protein